MLIVLALSREKDAYVSYDTTKEIDALVGELSIFNIHRCEYEPVAFDVEERC
jgi:hypothetical protein